MKIPILNVYHLLCYAWGHVEELDLVDRAAVHRLDQVHDLLGTVLAEGTFRLVRRGIDRGYIETTEELAGLRGKLEFGAMTKRAVRARGRTVCTFEELSTDVLHNRILRSTLDILLRVQDLDRTVRRDVALAHDKLSGIEVVELSPRLFRTVQLDRNQRIYTFLLSVCRLILDSLLVEERSGDARFRDFRDDYERMWKLFEDFAAEFYRRRKGSFRVAKQSSMPWHDAGGRTTDDLMLIPMMSPDLVLEAPHRRIILDTKFYASPLSHRHGTEKLRSNHLYQLLAYLENRQASEPDGAWHEGVLLYASAGTTLRVDLELQGFRVQARTVDLARPWPEIEGEMLAVIEDGPGGLHN